MGPTLIGHINICDTLFMHDAKLDRALRAYRRAEAALERSRQELADAIGSAVYERGLRQVDVVRQTGYTREHIRRICRDYAARKSGRAGAGSTNTTRSGS